MVMTQNERQKKWSAKYARPAITIPKEKNENYKTFVKSKGYNSLNDYFNTIIEYDIKNNIVPCKNDIVEYIKSED